MSPEICGILEPYPVRTVELGVQSLCDAVLIQSRRGYSVETVAEAVASVRKYGWDLGIQLMAGLPGDTREHFLRTVSRAVDLRPDFVRIYPTLVLEGTVLAEWYRGGAYRPLSVEEAVDWCAPAYESFLHADIPIARMGLHADPELEKPGHVLAGPYHPAFGYLVRAHWWRSRVDGYLQAHAGEAVRTEGSPREMSIRVNGRFLSEVTGPFKSNIAHWQKKWDFRRVRVISVPGPSEPGPPSFECFLE